MFISQIVNTLKNLPTLIKKNESVHPTRAWHEGVYAGTTKVRFKDAVIGQNYVLQCMYPGTKPCWIPITLLSKSNGKRLGMKTAEITFRTIGDGGTLTRTIGKLGYAYLLKY